MTPSSAPNTGRIQPGASSSPRGVTTVPSTLGSPAASPTRCAMPFSSSDACSNVAPGAIRPTPWSHWLPRSSSQLSPPLNSGASVTGTNRSKLSPAVTPPNIGGATPMIVRSRPFTATWVPITAESAWSRSCQKACPTTTTGVPRGSSSAWKPRPSTGLTRSTSK